MMWRGLRRKVLGSVFVAVIAIVASCVAVTPAHADAGYYETKETARSISVGQTISALSKDGSDSDWYRFTLSRPGYVQISFTNDLGAGIHCSWSVELLDHQGLSYSGQSLFDRYEFKADESSHTSPKVGLPAGTYYVQVSPWAVSNLHYTMRVNFTASSNWEQEFNDDFVHANPLSLNTTINGSTIDDYDDDWFKIVLPSSGYIQVSFKNAQHTKGVWDVRVTDASGNANDLGKCFDYYTFNANEATHSGNRIGLAAGTYYVKVNPYNANGYTYQLKVGFTKSSAWETEPNNLFENADAISVGKTVNGSSTYEGGDEDWYRFSLTKKTRVRIQMTNTTHSSGGWTVQFADKNGQSIKSFDFAATSGSHSSDVVELAAGTYYVRVKTYYQQLGDYGYRYSLTVQNASTATRTMYRLYNRYTGEHFYTASATERDSLRRSGWTYEGTGWIAPTSGTPVYRLYNPWVDGGDHHYTTSVSEYDALGRLGWRQEGVGWRSGGSVKVYRQYNKYATTGTHNYTTSKAENDALVRLGWKAEGVGWYAVRAK